MAANAQGLRECGLIVMAVVILHNVCGYVLGLGVARLLKMTRPEAVAVSIEVGMQNSGLACSLATTHFPNLAMATVPGAVFSVWHNISGSLYARLNQRIALRLQRSSGTSPDARSLPKKSE